MSDAVSIASKSSYLSNGSMVRKKTSKADWRVVVRDGFTALFDMVGDWTYLYAIFHRDYDADGNMDTYLLRIEFNYKLIINVVLSFCILSTVLTVWTITTSLGRRCGKNSMCCNCTVPRLAMAGILLEDLPQFILTAWIDFTFSGGFTPAGVLNICSSMTSLVNRATTRYDDILDEDKNAYSQTELGTVYESMN
mmetsp:Transcript_14223/g.34375  ORF Transcript_14223/g.34375 Transcript_14223/m.34375 type:complete len:194 (+) Transcript_14223:105-686(+)